MRSGRCSSIAKLRYRSRFGSHDRVVKSKALGPLQLPAFPLTFCLKDHVLLLLGRGQFVVFPLSLFRISDLQDLFRSQGLLGYPLGLVGRFFAPDPYGILLPLTTLPAHLLRSRFRNEGMRVTMEAWTSLGSEAFPLVNPRRFVLPWLTTRLRHQVVLLQDLLVPSQLLLQVGELFAQLRIFPVGLVLLVEEREQTLLASLELKQTHLIMSG